MKRKYKIKVLDDRGKPIAEVNRVLVSEQIGNFNPIFCTYAGERHLVRSASGDLSDPFRRDPSYLNSLYIVTIETKGADND